MLWTDLFPRYAGHGQSDVTIAPFVTFHHPLPSKLAHFMQDLSCGGWFGGASYSRKMV